ncbi:sensor histidine kinase [Catenulispora sp. NF23]|uniref:Oxygen sensor histidine kinase NreB n=1 Tax=Catenulispora pinistramenti TaxID=2705254 RepID=A0ABS5L593_9ACTN|nr:sensor histidine kinase [Catenulispora pinistramenti]MBS2537578.1 sensor histidine kinase [Catenulispora pinistramenti]MBS2553492.1 sensor histidine kinase [Catenulispora pinistramenti]
METATIQRWIPYAGLAISVPLALIVGPKTTAFYAVAVGVSTVAALWLLWGMPLWMQEARDRAPVGWRPVVYYVGLLALVGTLVVISPLFGFFAVIGYLHAQILPGRWNLVGVGGTAAAMAACQMGGVHNIHGLGICFYVILFLVNGMIAGSMTVAGTAEDAHRRELAEANQRLHEMLEENAGLHAQLVAQAREAGVMDERQRLAGEIHDTIAQGLTGIVRQLEVVERFGEDAEKRQHHLTLARELARESLAEARRSVQALRPGPLAVAQLPEALAELTAAWSRTAGIDARVEVSGEAVALPPEVEVVLFRAAQEALANADKYSGAARVGVTLSYTPDVVVLDVVDDGSGFDSAGLAAAGPSANGTGYGLAAMRSRLGQIGGTLTVESEPGDGTAISAAVPAPGCPVLGVTPGTMVATGAWAAPVAAVAG